MKYFVRKILKCIDNLNVSDLKKIYYVELLQFLINNYSYKKSDYINVCNTLNFVMNNFNNDENIKDIFYILYLTTDNIRYKNLIKIYNYKLYGVEKFDL